MNNNQTYLKKYLKYKEKYLNLIKMKNILKVGSYRYINNHNLDSGINPIKVIQLTNNNILVCNGIKRGPPTTNFKIFDKEGNLVKDFQTGSFILYAADVKQLLDGSIAICDSKYGNISIFDVDGNYSKNIKAKFDVPRQIIQLKNHNIVVINLDTINIYDLNDNSIAEIKSRQINSHQINSQILPDIKFANIISLSGDDDDFGIYFKQPGLNNIFIYGNDGTFKHTIQITGLNDDNLAILSINQIIQLHDNRLSILFDNNCIIICDLSGVTEVIIRHTTGNLSSIITQLQNNNIIICCDGSLSEYNTSGDFITGSVWSTNNPAPFESSSMIQLRDRRIAICDNENMCVRLFSLEEYTITIDTVLRAINDNYHFVYNYDPNNINIGYFPENTDKLFSYEIESEKINIFDTLFANKHYIINGETPKFVFINILTLQPDVGVDAGALSRTVFDELSNYLSYEENPYFYQDDDTKLYKLKVITKQDNLDKLYFLGQLFGLALKLEIIIPINLDPILLYQLSHDLKPDDITETIIMNILNSYGSNDISNTPPFICYNENKALFQSRCTSLVNGDGDMEYIFKTSIENGVLNSDQIKVLKEHTTNNFKDTYNILNTTTTKFVDGFKSQLNVNNEVVLVLIKDLPLKLLDTLIAGISVVTLELFYKNTIFYGFNNDEYIIKDIIKSYTETIGEQKYLEILVLVMTGSPRLPGNGYPHNKKLHFDLTPSTGYKTIDIHACDKQMQIKESVFIDYKKKMAEEKEGVQETKGEIPEPYDNRNELFTAFDFDLLVSMRKEFSNC